tara:strand:- start:111089 stop:112099 length:1011 start_codon:yes stop_codon:yes gene_type:complete
VNKKNVSFSLGFGAAAVLAVSYMMASSGLVTTCDSEEAFSRKFFEEFPSLKGRAYAFKTPICNLFAVKNGDLYVFFDSNLKASIQGNMDALQGSDVAPIRIFGSTEIKPVISKQPTRINRNYKYEIGYADNESDRTMVNTSSSESAASVVQNGAPKSPSQHIGITNRAVNEDLKNLDFSILPFFKSESSRGVLLTFVDVTCPACRRYTENIENLNSKGYDVYLAPYPRSGSNSLVAKRMQNLWCENYLNKQSSLSNITSSFKGNSLRPPECADTAYLSKFEQFVKFGSKHLNQTTPVSFTNNGITIIANHPADVFDSAFLYGQELTKFTNKQKEVK